MNVFVAKFKIITAKRIMWYVLVQFLGILLSTVDILTAYVLRCIKDWDQHKKDIYKRHFNLLLFTVYINLCKTFMGNTSFPYLRKYLNEAPPTN